MQSQTTLVIAGTDEAGRGMVRRLAARGAPVRAACRSREPLCAEEDLRIWGRALMDGRRGADAGGIR